MMGAINRFMASSLALLAASGTPVDVFDPLRGYEFTATKSRSRNRLPGRPRRSGSKLARKALQGRIGRATIR